MKFRILAGQAAAVLICSTTFAQAPSPAPSPTPGARTTYGIYFSRDLSHLLADDTNPLKMSQPQQLTDTRGCNITYGQDSAITCFLTSSCSADANILPGCVLVFNGPSGMTISDVANMAAVTSSSASPGPSSIIALPNGDSVAALFEGLKNS